MNNPEIRFQDNNGKQYVAIESVKLGSLCSVKTGMLNANDADKCGKYPFFTCGKEVLRSNHHSFNGDAILINGNGDLGYTRSYSGEFDAYQRTYVLQNFKAKYRFLENAIKRFLPYKISKSAFGSSMPYITADVLQTLDIPVPSVLEQKDIGNLFYLLDKKIAAEDKTTSTLQSIKASLLDGMFPQEGESVPRIRFDGFTDPWEQRKLSELVTEVTRTDEKSNAPVMMITANDGFINQSERYSTNNAGQSLKKYILLKKGELAYNHGASKLRPYGSCFALTTEEEARIPFVYHCFSANESNPEFLSLVLNGKSVERQLRRIVSSGARMDGLLNISFYEYTSIPVMIPGIEEQNKIAAYFRDLDSLITLHQRKCGKLKDIKTALLQHMF